MDYPFRPISASAVSRVLALADFKRARSGNHWSNGYQVTGLGNLVEVSYMATRGEDGHAVMERMVAVINGKDGYVAWIGRPDWMGEDVNGGYSVMVRKTIPTVAPAARELEAHKAHAIRVEGDAKKTAAQETQRAAIEASLAEKKAEEPQEPVQERPAEAKKVIQELAVEFEDDHHSVAATALPALRAALDAHKSDFFTLLRGEDDDMVLHVRHFHGNKVRVAAVHFEEMGGTFFTHHSQEYFASVSDIVGHLELFLVGE